VAANLRDVCDRLAVGADPQPESHRGERSPRTVEVRRATGYKDRQGSKPSNHTLPEEKPEA
jgi:hypothetical protein